MVAFFRIALCKWVDSRPPLWENLVSTLCLGLRLSFLRLDLGKRVASRPPLLGASGSPSFSWTSANGLPPDRPSGKSMSPFISDCSPLPAPEFASCCGCSNCGPLPGPESVRSGGCCSGNAGDCNWGPLPMPESVPSGISSPSVFLARAPLWLPSSALPFANGLIPDRPCRNMSGHSRWAVQPLDWRRWYSKINSYVVVVLYTKYDDFPCNR